jgi:hypothetical protein
MIDAAEAALSHALVAMVGGPCPSVLPAEVMEYLCSHFHVREQEVLIRRSCPDDFLLIFSNAAAAERVQHPLFKCAPVLCLSCPHPPSAGRGPSRAVWLWRLFPYALSR